jgi:hypothetical protein
MCCPLDQGRRFIHCRVYKSIAKSDDDDDEYYYYDDYDGGDDMLMKMTDVSVKI